MLVASQTCMVLSDALDKVGIAFGISGFTAGWHYGYEFDIRKLANLSEDGKRRFDEAHAKANGPAGANFHRNDPLVEYVYKTPDET